jgi:hypothetical protein
MRDKKPIPKNQSQITQDSLASAYYQNKPDSSTVFSQNRALERSRKGDKIKDISIGLEDIDYALMYYFQNIIKPTVSQDGNLIEVPIMYGSPERWQSVQADGYYRDTNGKAVFPLIMFKRTNIEKNRTLGNKLDGNKAHNFQVFESRYNQRNQYDQFSVLTNAKPSKQYYVSVVPDYVTVTYDVVILTNFVEQNNKLIEAIEFASDSYWGDFNRWHFRTSLDSFSVTNTINTGEDRISSTTVSLKVNGYLIADSINKELASSNLTYSPSRIIFTFETVSTDEAMKQLSQPLKTPKTAMGSFSPIDSYNVNITNVNATNIDNVTLTYLVTNKSLTALAGQVTGDTAKFSGSFKEAPFPLPPTSATNFTFFVNGQYIDVDSVVAFNDNGDGTCTLTIDPIKLQYPFVLNDQVVAIGKFN